MHARTHACMQCHRKPIKRGGGGGGGRETNGCRMSVNCGLLLLYFSNTTRRHID